MIHHVTLFVLSTCVLTGVSLGQELRPPVDVPNPDPSGMEWRVSERIRESRAAVAADPESAQAWRHLAMVFDAHFLLDEARVCYEHAAEIAPDDFQSHYLLAIIYQRESESVEPALHALRRAAELRPGYAPVQFRIGYNLARVGKADEARKAYLKAIQLDPDLAIAHRALGQLQLTLGDPTAAIERLERAQQLMPNDSVVHTALAQAFRRLGQQERSRQALKTAENLKPSHRFDDPVQGEVPDLAINSNACMQRGRRLMGARDYPAAIEQLKIVLEIAPSDPNLRRTIGWAYMATRQIDSAIEHLSEAVRLQDDFVQARIMLGFLMMRTNQLDQALDQYEQAIKHDPQNAGAHAGLAMVLAQRGDIDEAILACEKAAALDPDSADTHIVWGGALEQRGDMERAAEHYREALRVQPNHREADRRLREVMTRLEPVPVTP